MGCFFFKFFGVRKHRKCRHLENVTPSKHHEDGVTEALKVNEAIKEEEVPQAPIKPILESTEKPEEQLSCNEKKKVTFDLNVKTYESLSSESLFSLSIGSIEQAYGAGLGEKEVTSPMPQCGSPPKEETKKGSVSDRNAQVRSQSDETVLNSVENLTQWEVAKVRAALPLQQEEKENVNIEQDFDKSISPETSFKLYRKGSKENPSQNKLVDQEIAVDTSLSSWLATPSMSKSSADTVGNSPSIRMSSPRSHEDRPILGAVTVEELKQYSASNTPRRSRTRNPDETPIIGTVGSYWIHTGRAVDSDSGSSNKGRLKTKNDEKVKWNSIPFEERLERALKGGSDQV